VRENLPTGLICWGVIKKVYLTPKNFSYISSLCREAPNGRICTKFCTGGRPADVITCFKFFIDRLRDIGSARGRILPFSIDSLLLLTQLCATAHLWFRERTNVLSKMSFLAFWRPCKIIICVQNFIQIWNFEFLSTFSAAIKMYLIFKGKIYI